MNVELPLEMPQVIPPLQGSLADLVERLRGCSLVIDHDPKANNRLRAMLHGLAERPDWIALEGQDTHIDLSYHIRGYDACPEAMKVLEQIARQAAGILRELIHQRDKADMKAEEVAIVLLRSGKPHISALAQEALVDGTVLPILRDAWRDESA